MLWLHCSLSFGLNFTLSIIFFFAFRLSFRLSCAFCKNAALVMGVSAFFPPFSHLNPCFLVSPLHLKDYSGNISVNWDFLDSAGTVHSLSFVRAMHTRSLTRFCRQSQSRIRLQRRIIESKSRRMQRRLFVHPVPARLSESSSLHVEAFTLLAQ